MAARGGSGAETHLYTLDKPYMTHVRVLARTVHRHEAPARRTSLHTAACMRCPNGPFAPSPGCWPVTRDWLGIGTGCRSPRSTAKAGEEAQPVRLRVQRRRSKLPRANWSPDLQASASCASAGHPPSSAAWCAQHAASATSCRQHHPRLAASARQRAADRSGASSAQPSILIGKAAEARKGLAARPTFTALRANTAVL